MDYMFLIYSDPCEEWTPERAREATIRHWELMDDAGSRGVLKGASPLTSPATAVTVRSDRAGKISVSDGPFAETREYLAGYYLIDCRDAEEAREWAARIADAGCGSTVEMRPLAVMPKRIEAVPAHA